MNLEQWIGADHASVLNRLHGSIVQHVPAPLWSVAPPGGGSTITGLLFHMTYHQDLALNTAVRNRPPLLAEHRQALGLAGFSAAAGLSESETAGLTAAIDRDALMDYVTAVNESTAAWIHQLSAMALDSTPNAAWRLQHKAGVHADDVGWLFAMWADKPVSWFVQWECIGHGHTHVGEMTSIRNRLGLSPF